jgi:hypothetical protein
MDDIQNFIDQRKVAVTEKEPEFVVTVKRKMRPEIANPDGSYMTREQIIEDLKKRIDEGGLYLLKVTARHDLHIFHHSLGQWIRNVYGLWHDNHPYLPDGVHPDDYSMEIIEEFHDLLKSE